MKKQSISNSSIQYLTKHLSNSLSAIQSDISYYSLHIATLWERCDKETIEGQKWFGIMNQYKANQKKLKQDYKKLSEIQHNLKKQR